MSSITPRSGLPPAAPQEPRPQNLTQAAAQPTYVFRGHAAHVHNVCFLRENTGLLTGDADGWVVLWSLATKRATAVWRAHEGTILGLEGWGQNRIITHGRDHRLNVWELSPTEESSFSTVLPVDDSATRRKDPWLLHSLSVNALNFCSFATCAPSGPSPGASDEKTKRRYDNLIIVVPSTKDAQIDIFELPTEKRQHILPALSDAKTGMVMALKIMKETNLIVLASYESGHTCIHQHSAADDTWEVVYKSRAHTQPVLSLDSANSLRCYYTSSADAIIARHPMPPFADAASTDSPLQTVNTKHSGQQSLRVRSDNRIFATAGWDGRVRVYSTKTMKELAVLKWHKDGCYAVAFADVLAELLPEMENPEQATTNECQDSAYDDTFKTVQDRRLDKVRMTHWLAAGSKDGKVSLWNIY